MFNSLLSLFIRSSETFLQNETQLILSGVSERCLCGSFMLLLRQELNESEFSNYHSDIEYNRNFDGQIKTIINEDWEVTNITCDLIVHSRGLIPQQDNLIAIEMKKDSRQEAKKNKDRIRLKALTKPTNDSSTSSVDGRILPQHVCGYVLGVFYEISIAHRRVNIEYYRNGELYSQYNRHF